MCLHVIIMLLVLARNDYMTSCIGVWGLEMPNLIGFLKYPQVNSWREWKILSNLTPKTVATRNIFLGGH